MTSEVCEMNFGKSFMKLNWDVFAKAFGSLLGFASPNAQNYLHKGADHHKMWHFYEILYISLTLELLVPYVREALCLNKVTSSRGYWEWTYDVKNTNYIYMQNCVMTHLHRLMTLRSGKIYVSFYIHQFKMLFNEFNKLTIYIIY